MQDRFRFRAWCFKPYKGNPYMAAYISGICFDNNQVSTYITSNKEGFCVYDLDSVVLMQCTGLKDSEGKLIYEGDIVKNTWFTENLYASKKIEDFYKVIYDANSLQYRFILINGDDWLGWEDLQCESSIEIIGNIYENIELLEESNNASN